jgi:hypothetical protein
VSYDGVFAGPDLYVGIMNRVLELVGAYGVRVKVVENRARGGAVDRYLPGWMEP